jgi:hypothetical protein
MIHVNLYIKKDEETDDLPAYLKEAAKRAAKPTDSEQHIFYFKKR